ncbi:hypothetical protein [Homoserinimonas sp. OAct 916]|uniref:hypothetical protein n=1 Tax=Homoserinimonas sp. OAct 916 TaxID=2211450 RepID=UPI000DBE9EEC|nr:hypothetical protein [Homoserinimonas sp. OAct 916]
MGKRVHLPDHLSSAPFLLSEGMASGLTVGRMRGGDLSRPYSGVRVPQPGPTPLTLRQLAFTQQLRMPETWFFSHVTAAALWGAPLPAHHERSSMLHVASRAPVRAPRSTGVRGHKLHVDDGDVHSVDGLRVTGPERTWLDLGTVLALPDLVAVGDFLIRRRQPLTSRTTLETALGRYRTRRGVSNLRVAIELLDPNSESRKETQLRVIAVTGGIDGIPANLAITTRSGSRYRADLAIPGSRVILEYQSDYHAELDQVRRDMTRRSRLEADGWFVMYINADDLRDPVELVQRIRTVAASRQRR